MHAAGGGLVVLAARVSLLLADRNGLFFETPLVFCEFFLGAVMNDCLGFLARMLFGFCLAF